MKRSFDNCRATASVAVLRQWQAERLPYKKWKHSFEDKGRPEVQLRNDSTQAQ
jgi:hypothetical protein